MDLRYPVGQFKFSGTLSQEERGSLIDQIAATPENMRAAVSGLSNEQLDTPYRPDGWTVRQVVHHVPESHLNSYIRFKLAITEDQPTIKPYFEDRWAQLPDALVSPIEPSLDLLDALHQRWVWFLRSLKDEDFDRTFQHPEQGLVSLNKNVALYAWHGRHHVAHITSLRERENW
ncbi:MAG TPA: putative metal-dependent hydrolase [Pyrinomonadaceae bacterium]|nr:putative metal-dependent hydrolase [Pyrinomonadaceae bacterium]